MGHINRRCNSRFALKKGEKYEKKNNQFAVALKPPFTTRSQVRWFSNERKEEETLSTNRKDSRDSHYLCSFGDRHSFVKMPKRRLFQPYIYYIRARGILYLGVEKKLKKFFKKGLTSLYFLCYNVQVAAREVSFEVRRMVFENWTVRDEGTKQNTKV